VTQHEQPATRAGETDPPAAPMTTVTLVVPADPSRAKVARLTASALAAGAGLTVDAVDDVKIAVSEMLALLVGRGGGRPVTLVFSWAPGELAVEATSAVPPVDEDDPELELTNLVLDAVTASHGISHDGAQVRLVATVVSPVP
jgi:anti-sigma regulatory factor (Ser/Thr protein kinase)